MRSLDGSTLTPRQTIESAIRRATHEISKTETELAEAQIKVVDLSQALGALQEYRRQHQAALAQLKE